MGLIQQVKGMFPPGRSTALMVSGDEPLAIGGVSSFHTAAREGYQENLYVNTAIRLIGQSLGSIPIYPYRMTVDGTGRREIVANHPLNRLLRLPQGSFSDATMADLIQEWVGALLLGGEAYLEMRGPSQDGGGQPRELWVRTRDEMVPQTGAVEGLVASYRCTVSGQARDVSAERVMRWRCYNPTSKWRGYSPLWSAWNSLKTNSAGRVWNLALLIKQALPKFYIAVKGRWSEEERKRAQQTIKQKYGGLKQVTEPAIFEGDVELKPISLSPRDMEWAAGQVHSARELAVVLLVPPELLGFAEHRTYNSMPEALKYFYKLTNLPLLDAFLAKLNGKLAAQFGPDVYLGYDEDKIWALQEDRTAVWGRVKDAHFLTLNERREALGYEAVNGGDVLLVPSTWEVLDLAPTGEGTAL